jgi:hypothetical protein
MFVHTSILVHDMTLNSSTKIRSSQISLGKGALVSIGIFLHIVTFAEPATPTISLSKLPEHLQQQYEKIYPELTERNRCVVAFNDSYDTEKMLLECSFNTRHAGESERRALKYCEQKRKTKEISGPCRTVIDNSH